MTCVEIEEKLSAYADGELPAGERPAVDAHLASCGECRGALEALRAQHRELEAAFAPMREGADALARRVVEAVHARAPGRRFRARPWLPMIASAAAGFLAAWLIFRAPDRPPEGWTVGKAGQGYPVAEPAAAWLTLATGPVEVREGNDAWTSCEANSSVGVGTWVRTAPRAKCSFRWSDGTELYLNEATEVQIASPRTVQLARGEVYALANEQADPFRVEAPPGQLLANGASLNVLCGTRKGEPYLGNFAVTNGRVQVFPAKGQPLSLEGPEATLGKEGWHYAPPSTGKLVLATRWVHELLALKGDDPELDRRVQALLGEVGASPGRDPYEEEIRSLGERAAPGLVRALKGQTDAARRRHAARILADLAGPSLVPDLVALLGTSEPDVRRSCARGLQRVTGQPFRDDPGAWGAWLNENPLWGPASEAQKRSAATK
jgi:ferric-dicitrate binding protein FerR (iron transport regulator)